MRITLNKRNTYKKILLSFNIIKIYLYHVIDGLYNQIMVYKIIYVIQYLVSNYFIIISCKV